MCTTGRRIELHEAICKKFGEIGYWAWDPFNFETDDVESAIRDMARKHVYYQPKASVLIDYPCVVYKLSDMPSMHADNFPYHLHHVYQVTVIDRDPESKIREKIAELPTCRFTNSFISDNLYHFVFKVYN